MHEDGRVFADTPIANSCMRDTHFILRRNDSRITLRSELWSKLMIKKNITIYRDLFLLRSKKKGATTKCIYVDTDNRRQVTIAPHDEFSRFQVFKLKAPTAPNSPTAASTVSPSSLPLVPTLTTTAPTPPPPSASPDSAASSK
jgi:hypothetical protein